MGSLVLGSISVIPVLIGIFVTCSGPRPLLKAYGFKHYVTEFVTKIFLLWSVEKYSLVLVATQGSNFVRSTEKAHYLTLKDSAYSLSTLRVINSSIFNPSFFLKPT